jgi:hypothetical protein
MLGYKYVDASNEYARIQAKNSAGAATDIYLNAAGGSVRINKLNNNNIGDGFIELGEYGSGDRNSYIDFHSAYTYPQHDYEARIIRAPGINGAFQIKNNGSSPIQYIQEESAEHQWYASSNVLKMRLDINGNLTLAGNLSDERVKTDICETTLGLQFINTLKPSQYKYIIADEVLDVSKEKIENNKIVNDGKRKAGVRNHYGFIAQQVKEAAGDKDFAGFVYDSKTDTHKLNYQEFISPMVKAIQELSKENDYLKKKLEEKDKQIQDILLRLSLLESK